MGRLMTIILTNNFLYQFNKCLILTPIRSIEMSPIVNSDMVRIKSKNILLSRLQQSIFIIRSKYNNSFTNEIFNCWINSKAI